MADIPSSRDKYLEALDFLSNFLREHEKSLDVAVDELANVIERMRPAVDLELKLTELEGQIDTLQEQIAELARRVRYTKT